MALRSILVGVFLSSLLVIVVLRLSSARPEEVAESGPQAEPPSRLQAAVEPPARQPAQANAEGEAAPELGKELQPPSDSGIDYRFPDAFEERVITPSHVFEAMYGAMTLSELAAQQGMVEVEYFELSNRLVEERFAAGLYEEYPAESSADPEGEPDLPPWPYHKGLVKVQRTHSLPDGKLQILRTVLPFAEYPDLYGKSDELNWLNTHIHQLQKEQVAGQK